MEFRELNVALRTFRLHARRRQHLIAFGVRHRLRHGSVRPLSRLRHHHGVRAGRVRVRSNFRTALLGQSWKRGQRARNEQSGKRSVHAHPPLRFCPG